jgi:hypothetical protein
MLLKSLCQITILTEAVPKPTRTQVRVLEQAHLSKKWLRRTLEDPKLRENGGEALKTW